MKKTPSLSSSLEIAAVRIQYWFGKDKEILLNGNCALPQTQEFCKTHKCDLVKPPRIVPQADHLPHHGHTPTKKKTETRVRQVTNDFHSKPLGITIDQAHYSNTQNDLEYFQKENTLSSARVAHCPHKEHFLASKRFKTLSKPTDSYPKRHQVIAIKSSSKEELSTNPYIEEWQRFKEERHFQISRVIKYLAE